MNAKKRNENSSLSDSKKVTRHFYISNAVYDSLIAESEEKDVPVSKLLEKKLEVLNKIKLEVLKDEQL